MAKSKAKKTKKKTTQEKPYETSSPHEKVSYLIELLTRIGNGFETLTIYSKARGKAQKVLRRMMSQAEKDIDDCNSTDYEEYWKKTGLETQEAINETNAILLCQFICAFRKEAYIMLQSDAALQSFIVNNSQEDDSFCRDLGGNGSFRDNLLWRIQKIVHDSLESSKVAGLIEQFELILGRAEKKSAPLPYEPQEKDGQGNRISKDEANVRLRQLLKETPTWDWTCRKLKKLIPCHLAWIPYLPAWRAYHEKRKELRGNRTIDTVSLSKDLEAVFGQGEKDEALKQLIAEQEGEQREDARQAKLYLSHKKKPDQGRG